MLLARDVQAFSDQRTQIDRRPMEQPLARRSRRSQDLLHQARQTIAVLEHHPIKLAAPIRIEIVALERLEVQPNGRNRRLQLVGDRVDEGIVLFVPTHFPHQEDGVQHDAGNDDEEEDDAEDEKEAFAPVEQDPADVERHGSRDQARAEDDRGRDPLTAADRHKGEDKSIRNAEFGVRSSIPHSAFRIPNFPSHSEFQR